MRSLTTVAVLAAVTLVLVTGSAQAAQWQPWPHPSDSGRSLTYAAIDAAGDDDVWAVGHDFGNALDFRAVIQHWDGASWTSVPLPNAEPTPSRLFDVSAPESDRVWAVGRVATPFGQPSARTFVLRWNGTRWTDIAGPQTSVTTAYSVAAARGGNVWLAGPGLNPESGYEMPVVWRKVAGGWAEVPFPPVPGCRTTTNGLPYRAVVNDLATLDLPRSFAAGTCVTIDGQERGFLVRFDGSVWRPLVTPTDFAAHGSRGAMEGVSVSPSGKVWAVGSADTKPISYRGWATRVFPVAVPPQGQGATLAAVAARGDGAVVAAGTWTASDPLPRLNLAATLPASGDWALDPAPFGVYGNIQGVALEPSGTAWAAGVSSSDDRGLLVRRFPE